MPPAPKQEQKPHLLSGGWCFITQGVPRRTEPTPGRSQDKTHQPPQCCLAIPCPALSFPSHTRGFVLCSCFCELADHVKELQRGYGEQRRKGDSTADVSPEPSRPARARERPLVPSPWCSTNKASSDMKCWQYFYRLVLL